MSEDALANIKQTFFLECDELLGELETGLLDLQEGTAEPDTINAVFRAVHSVKGGAGAFHLNDLVQFAHNFETALDHLRSGRVETSPAYIKTFLRASDKLSDLVRAARNGVDADEAQRQSLQDELALIGPQRVCSENNEFESEKSQEKEEDFVFEPISVSLEEILSGSNDGKSASAHTYIIQFTPFRELYAKANDPSIILRELSHLGDISVCCDASDLPSLFELDPEAAYLKWTIRIETEQDEAAIRHIFEFVEDDCELNIQLDLANAYASDGKSDLSYSKPEGAEDKSTKHFISEAEHSEPSPLQASTPGSTSKQTATSLSLAAPTTIRVDIERVDRFVDLIGELVINQAMLAQKINDAGLTRGSSIAVGLDEIDRLLRAIQDSAMAIRAQPVKPIFQRMSRVVREAADATGKSVHLITEGENAEVDKTIIERLSDPLTHMIRNAIDHGIETPERRIAAGKPSQGVVRLSALHRSGRIVIEVSDDGAGIDRARVKEIAINKGLIASNAALSDDEIDDLIFKPGFSTAQSISDISGRGVGMDVVRRSIQALGGRISITSQYGEGSTFSLSLPLTLAVLDGMVVSVADETLVLPLAAIVETLLPKPQWVQGIGSEAQVMLVRGDITRVIDLGAELGYRTPLSDFSSAVAVLIETERGGRRALLVDAIIDQRQIVIKSLEGNYGAVPGIAAATILGDGRVALIVDVDAIAANAVILKSVQRPLPLQVNA